MKHQLEKSNPLAIAQGRWFMPLSTGSPWHVHQYFMGVSTGS